MGKMDKAKALLGEIPEAPQELDVYTQWWNTQGREDLSARANVLTSELKSTTAQH
jgi:hypothetical protein